MGRRHAIVVGGLLVAAILVAVSVDPTEGSQTGEIGPVAATAGSAGEATEDGEAVHRIDRNATMREGVCAWLTPMQPYGACVENGDARVGWTLELPGPVTQAELRLEWDADTPATEELNLRYRSSEVAYVTAGEAPLVLELEDQSLDGAHLIDLWWKPYNMGNVQAYAEEDVRLTGELVYETAG